MMCLNFYARLLLSNYLNLLSQSCKLKYADKKINKVIFKS